MIPLFFNEESNNDRNYFLLYCLTIFYFIKYKYGKSKQQTDNL